MALKRKFENSIENTNEVSKSKKMIYEHICYGKFSSGWIPVFGVETYYSVNVQVGIFGDAILQTMMCTYPTMLNK